MRYDTCICACVCVFVKTRVVKREEGCMRRPRTRVLPHVTVVSHRVRPRGLNRGRKERRAFRGGGCEPPSRFRRRDGGRVRFLIEFRAASIAVPCVSAARLVLLLSFSPPVPVRLRPLIVMHTRLSYYLYTRRAIRGIVKLFWYF